MHIPVKSVNGLLWLWLALVDRPNVLILKSLWAEILANVLLEPERWLYLDFLCHQIMNISCKRMWILCVYVFFIFSRLAKLHIITVFHFCHLEFILQWHKKSYYFLHKSFNRKKLWVLHCGICVQNNWNSAAYAINPNVLGFIGRDLCFGLLK